MAQYGPTNPIDRAMKVVKFVHHHRFWTLRDIADHLEVSEMTAARYRDHLSCNYPVTVVREPIFNRGGQPTLYTRKGENV